MGKYYATVNFARYKNLDASIYNITSQPSVSMPYMYIQVLKGSYDHIITASMKTNTTFSFFKLKIYFFE